MNLHKALRRVWENGEDCRYIPMATEAGVSGAWRVWDQAEKRFLSDADVRKIDPWEVFRQVH